MKFSLGILDCPPRSSPLPQRRQCWRASQTCLRATLPGPWLRTRGADEAEFGKRGFMVWWSLQKCNPLRNVPPRCWETLEDGKTNKAAAYLEHTPALPHLQDIYLLASGSVCANIIPYSLIIPGAKGTPSVTLLIFSQGLV